MPATFAHCLMAQKAISRIQEKLKTTGDKKRLEYAAKIGIKNNFVIMGAAGPDYPYLTDILTTGILQVSHTWANRMHYEDTLSFVEGGIRKLAAMVDKSAEAFSIRLAWFCGFVSHIVADSYVHPVINSIVHGTYIFTHTEHARCELIQDIYIFNAQTGEDIVNSNPREGSFGYLKILEECSDPDDADKNRIHPEIRDFWKNLLETAHPHATEYFADINPDRWHYNYKGRVNFMADPGAIFRHVINLIGREYVKESDLSPNDKEKYIEKITLPNGKPSNYDNVFDKAVDLIVDTWIQIFDDIENKNSQAIANFIKDWDLDTGVDVSKVDLWTKEA